MVASATSSWTGRSSTACARRRSWSSNGGSTTTPGDHTAHWATARRHRKPSSRWTEDRPCT